MDSKITMIVKNNELYKLSWAVLPDKYIDDVMNRAQGYEDFDDNDAFDLMIDAIDDYLNDEHSGSDDDFHDFNELTSMVFNYIYSGMSLDEAETKVFDD